MKKYLSIALMSIFILGFSVSGVIAGTEKNSLANDVTSKVSNSNETVTQPVNESVNQSSNQSIKQASSNDKTNQVNETKIAEKSSAAKQKFRVGPTVVLRPVNDVVTKGQDGLVELYVDNPTLNEVTLNVDARITVPSGIQVYGQGFGQADAAGTVYGTFSVPPGKVRTININVKGDKVGTYTIHFSGMYWPGDNKDNYNPISLTHPFEVKEPSTKSQESSSSGSSSGVKAQGSGSFSIPGFGIFIAVLGLLAVYIRRRE